MTKLKFTYLIALAVLVSVSKASFAQDTIYNDAGLDYTLSEVIVRNNFDYKEVLKKIKEDSSFYKAFKTLRTIGYTSYNHIEMKNKEKEKYLEEVERLEKLKRKIKWKKI